MIKPSTTTQTTVAGAIAFAIIVSTISVSIGYDPVRAIGIGVISGSTFGAARSFFEDEPTVAIGFLVITIVLIGVYVAVNVGW